MEQLVVATCVCGGYGILRDASAPPGQCHEGDPPPKPSHSSLQQAILILPCLERGYTGSGVELDSTIEHAPTCPAYYVTRVAVHLDAHYSAGKWDLVRALEASLELEGDRPLSEVLQEIRKDNG